MTATTPEERLCSRGWRLLHSWWLIVPIISLGILNFLPFLVNGIRARRRSWLIIAGVFFAVVVVYIAFFSNIDTGTKAAPKNSYVGGYLVLNWIAGIVATIATNRSRLRWRAAKDDRAWYRTGAGDPSLAAAPAADASMGSDSVDAILRGHAPAMSPSDAVGSRFSGGRPIDINMATREELAEGLHLDPAAAAQIESARVRLGGFRDAEQLMTEAGLSPHVFLALRDRVTVSPRDVPRAETPGGGGRRLEF